MTTFNEHDHPRAGTGRFTEKQHTASAVTLDGKPTSAETAAGRSLDALHRMEDLQELLDSGNPADISAAYDRMQRVSAAVEKARSALARAHISNTIREVYPTATTLEMSNWGSSSEPAFVATAVRDANGSVLWNSDDRKPGESSPDWDLAITMPLRDLDENTITVDADNFRSYARNAIRLD